MLDLEDIRKNTGELVTKKRGIISSSNKNKFHKGWVLYSKLRPYLNKVLVADEDGVCTTEIVPINTKAAKVPLLAEYLQSYLMSPYFLSYANQLAHGVKMPRIGTKDAKAALVPIPPIKEQARIVQKLSNILKLISSADKSRQELKHLGDILKQQLLLQAIQGKLVPQLENEPKVKQIGDVPEDVPFDIPEKWAWIQLGELINYGSSKQIKGSQITPSTWVLDLEDIEKNSGKLLKKKYGTKTTSNKSCFKKGDVLYGKLRPYLNKVLIADEDGCCSTEIVPISVSSAKLELDAEFLCYFLRSPYFVGYANSCAYGVKMPRLGTKDAKSAWVAIPPLKEQRRIVTHINELLSKVECLKAN